MSLGTVLVTGGSSGIGLGIAIEVIKSGARVVIASSTQAKIDDAVAHLNSLASDTSSSPRAFGHVIDLSHEETLEENVISLLKYASSPAVTGNDSGKINHIAHCAGGHTPGTLKDFSPVGAFKGWTTKYLAALTLAKHAPAYLAPGKASSLTLTSGTLVTKPIAGMTTLLGPAIVVDGIVRPLAIDLAPIRVNVVAPGAVDTPLLRGFGKDGADASLKLWAEDTLLKAVSTPEEMAQAYLYFMRDTNTTGMSLRSDGGRQLRIG